MPRINTLIFSFIITSLGGCTIIQTKTLQETEQAIQMPAPETKSLIYIVKPSTYVAGARHFMIYINNNAIGQLGSGHFFTVITPPGKYIITTEVQDHVVAETIYTLTETPSALKTFSANMLSDKKGVLIDASPGNKYYVELNMGMLSLDIDMTDISIFKKGTFSNPSLVRIINLHDEIQEH